jgi:curved DNA-binding protein CbpA
VTSRERRDPYIVLGAPREASGEEIARACRSAARASHPDSGGAGSAERFQAVSDAYDVLSDPRRRVVWDRSHPLARSRTADARGKSVRYAAPGLQHLVLGRPAPAGLVDARLSGGGIVNENLLSISGSRFAEEMGQAQLVERPYGGRCRAALRYPYEQPPAAHVPRCRAAVRPHSWAGDPAASASRTSSAERSTTWQPVSGQVDPPDPRLR